MFTHIRFKCNKSHGISYGPNNTPISESEVSGAFVPSGQWGFALENQYLEEAKKDGLRELISSSPALFLALRLHSALSVWSPAVASQGQSRIMVNMWILT